MIIGVGGLKGAGKDTFAQIVDQWAEEHAVSPSVHTWHFADPLKKSLAALLGTSVEWINSNKDNPVKFDLPGGQKMTLRTLLQRYGTEAHRDIFGQEFWINQTREYLNGIDHTDICVIPDVRFENEVELVKSYNGVLVYIENDRVSKDDNHISETQIEDLDFDVSIENNGSLFDFKQRVYRFMNTYYTTQMGLPTGAR